MRIVTDLLTGLETLLLFASHVTMAPLSLRLRSCKVKVEVTVEPEETSPVPCCSFPDRIHLTLGFGTPKVNEKSVMLFCDAESPGNFGFGLSVFSE